MREAIYIPGICMPYRSTRPSINSSSRLPLVSPSRASVRDGERQPEEPAGVILLGALRMLLGFSTLYVLLRVVLLASFSFFHIAYIDTYAYMHTLQDLNFMILSTISI